MQSILIYLCHDLWATRFLTFTESEDPHLAQSCQVAASPDFRAATDVELALGKVGAEIWINLAWKFTRNKVQT